MPRRLPALCAAALLCAPALPAQSAAEPPIKLSEFVVTPSRFGVGEERVTAAATLTSAELETLPQVGDDLYRSIARLPGLAADDFTAQFWVRGAPNTELLARLDGVQLLEPFHLKDVDGALSIVDPATISRLDLATGGFGVEAGDRLAGMLTLETKTPTARRTALALSLTGFSAMNQGTAAGGRARWLASARRGYPDVALRFAHRDDEVYPRYYDVSGKLEYQLASEQTLSLHVLHAGDTLRYHRAGNPDLNSSYDSDYVWTRWRGAAGPLLSGEAVVSFAALGWRRDASGPLDGFPFTLHDRRRLEVTAVRNDWTLTLGERALLHAGLEAQHSRAPYDYRVNRQYSVITAGRQTVAVDTWGARFRAQGDTAAAFVSARVRPVGSLVVEPGLRFDRRTFSGDRTWDPRLNVAWPLGATTLRAASGGYSQAQGVQELSVADREFRPHPAERAEQRVLGAEHPLGHGVSLRIEAYERITTHVRPRWENLDNPYDLFPEAQADRVLLAPTRARARGLELLLAGRGNSQWSWDVSYALARTEELLAGQWVPRSRDQRHTFYGDVTYAPNSRWQFSAAWQFHTGWPTTDVVYSLAPLTNGRRVLVSANGPVYGLRLPDYHRLDLRATRRFATQRGNVRAFIDLFNAYDRTNVIGFNHRVTIAGTQVTVVRTPREQLPFLPSIGAEWEF